MHCKYISFEDKRKSNRPENIIPIKRGLQELSNTISAFICVEKWDKIENVENYVDIIVQYAKLIKNNYIFIVPFAHLSNNLANSENSIEILDLITQKLKAKEFIIYESSFGYHKKFEYELIKSSVYPHPGSVAYRQFPIDIQDELLNYIKSFGIEKTNQLLEGLKNND